MILTRTLFAVSSLLICLAKCDLLDLYVEHMDEVMHTAEYDRQRHNPSSGNSNVHTRNERSLVEGPTTTTYHRFLRFKKQRLDVDDDYFTATSSSAAKKLRPHHHVKHDGLEYPNVREENFDVEHEFVKNNSWKEQLAESRHEAAAPPTIETLELLDIPNAANDNNDNGNVQQQQQPQYSELIDETPLREGFAKHLAKIGNARSPKKYYSDHEKLDKSIRKLLRKLDGRSEESHNKRRHREGRRHRRHVEAAKFTRQEELSDDGDVVLEWDPSDDETVTFRVTARTLGYFGVGFNGKTSFKGADLIVGWVDDHTGAVNLLVRIVFFYI